MVTLLPGHGLTRGIAAEVVNKKLIGKGVNKGAAKHKANIRDKMALPLETAGQGLPYLGVFKEESDVVGERQNSDCN